MRRLQIPVSTKFWAILLGFILWMPALGQGAEVPVFGPETFAPSGDDDVSIIRTFDVPRTASGQLVLSPIIPVGSHGDDDDGEGGIELEELQIKLNGTTILNLDDEEDINTDLIIPVSLISGTNTLKISMDDDTEGSFAIIINAFSEAPTAAFTTTPTPATGPVPLTVAFDASASTDPDNDIATYFWDFGDGNTGTGITTSHEYTTPGTFTATLTVTDVFGLTGTATASIEVTDPNTAPVADILFGPSSSLIPFTASFDGSASIDAENNIASYDWDFGDGNAGTGITTTHEYTTGGVFTVTLTVTDAFGLSGQATATITALTNVPPTIQISSPANDAFVIQNRPEISVSYSDNSAVDTASLAFTANGTALPVDCQLNDFFWNLYANSGPAGR